MKTEGTSCQPKHKIKPNTLKQKPFEDLTVRCFEVCMVWLWYLIWTVYMNCLHIHIIITCMLEMLICLSSFKTCIELCKQTWTGHNTANICRCLCWRCASRVLTCTLFLIKEEMCYHPVSQQQASSVPVSKQYIHQLLWNRC